MPLCLSASSRSFYASSSVDRSRCRFCGLDSESRTIFAKFMFNTMNDTGPRRAAPRAESSASMVHHFKSVINNSRHACAAPCKLGEVIIILMEKLRKQYFFTCDLVGVGVALTFRKKVESIRQFFFGQSCDGGTGGYRGCGQQQRRTWDHNQVHRRKIKLYRILNSFVIISAYS